MHKSLTAAKVFRAAENEDYVGFCVKCGRKHHGVDPDARKDECEKCGAKAVYGAEELCLYMY